MNISVEEIEKTRQQIVEELKLLDKQYEKLDKSQQERSKRIKQIKTEIDDQNLKLERLNIQLVYKSSEMQSFQLKPDAEIFNQNRIYLKQRKELMNNKKCENKFQSRVLNTNLIFFEEKYNDLEFEHSIKSNSKLLEDIFNQTPNHLEKRKELIKEIEIVEHEFKCLLNKDLSTKLIFLEEKYKTVQVYQNFLAEIFKNFENQYNLAQIQKEKLLEDFIHDHSIREKINEQLLNFEKIDLTDLKKTQTIKFILDVEQQEREKKRLLEILKRIKQGKELCNQESENRIILLINNINLEEPDKENFLKKVCLCNRKCEETWAVKEIILGLIRCFDEQSKLILKKSEKLQQKFKDLKPILHDLILQLEKLEKDTEKLENKRVEERQKFKMSLKELNSLDTQQRETRYILERLQKQSNLSKNQLEKQTKENENLQIDSEKMEKRYELLKQKELLVEFKDLIINLEEEIIELERSQLASERLDRQRKAKNIQKDNCLEKIHYENFENFLKEAKFYKNQLLIDEFSSLVEILIGQKLA